MLSTPELIIALLVLNLFASFRAETRRCTYRPFKSIRLIAGEPSASARNNLQKLQSAKAIQPSA
jgi:hypothetical protein